MKIAIEGCAHGELDKIYDTIAEIEEREGFKVDLLLCCGDFQATRNMEDLQTMAVSKKYQNMGTFYKYYGGELKAPILTIFIGGNHEASNYIQELPYGGWVAPNIYYLGYAGVVRVNGLRIVGLSGIYKGHDYLKGRFEYSPYTESTKRSVYHVRQLEVFRLKQLSGKIDIIMSHDWPRGIYKFGNQAQLARFKPFLREEMQGGKLGSPPCENLLNKLQPQYWFAAHLHCKFAALVPHETQKSFDGDNDADKAEGERIEKKEHFTKFLALDKCLPRRRFLQILDIECSINSNCDDQPLCLEYDLEWLTILHSTNHLINIKESNYYLPNEKGTMGERYNFTPTAEEMAEILKKFNGDLKIPDNFELTVEPYKTGNDSKGLHYNQPKSRINPQCLHFCDVLGIDDPLSLSMLIGGHELIHSSTFKSTLNYHINSSDSFVSDVSSSTLKRRCGLSLPKPYAQQSDELQLPSSDSEDLDKDTVDHVQVPSPVSKNETPLFKQLKRRNQDIYQNKEDDEDKK